VFSLFSCQKTTVEQHAKQADWATRKAKITNFADFHQGKSYLPVYSHVYHIHEHRTFDLTTTVSIRNVSMIDTIYILKADYYNTIGNNIRQYIKKPIFLQPMETVEIVIDEEDSEGGSGANFVFEWAVKNDKNPPLFEAVMISTYGQQGVSFITRGVEVFE
jgi:hypothetical protein